MTTTDGKSGDEVSQLTEDTLSLRVGGDGAPSEDGDDDVVDPWNVTSKSDAGIDYDKLISETTNQ